MSEKYLRLGSLYLESKGFFTILIKPGFSTVSMGTISLTTCIPIASVTLLLQSTADCLWGREQLANDSIGPVTSPGRVGEWASLSLLSAQSQSIRWSAVVGDAASSSMYCSALLQIVSCIVCIQVFPAVRLKRRSLEQKLFTAGSRHACLFTQGGRQLRWPRRAKHAHITNALLTALVV